MAKELDELDFLDAIAQSAQEVAEGVADVKFDAERIAKTCEGLERRGEAINQAAALAAKSAVAEALNEWQAKSLKGMAEASAMYANSLKAQVEEQKKETAAERRAAKITTCCMALMLIASGIGERILAQQAGVQIDAANQALADANSLIGQVNASLGAALQPVAVAQPEPISEFFGLACDYITWACILGGVCYLGYQFYRYLFKK